MNTSENRYQAQAVRFLDSRGGWSVYLRVIDRTKRITVLPETTIPLPNGQRAEDFNPVAMLFDLGWVVETPYVEWARDWPTGGAYTHDVRPRAIPKD